VAALAVVLAVVGAVLALAGSRGGTQAGEPGAASAQARASLPRASADRFDGARALALVRRQVALGPRPAGSRPLRRLAGDLRRRLPRGRFEAVPGDPPGMRNVVGTVPGRRPALVIGAHYDTEATVEDFVGANDGAAGTAVAVELGRALRGLRRPRARARSASSCSTARRSPPSATGATSTPPRCAARAPTSPPTRATCGRWCSWTTWATGAAAAAGGHVGHGAVGGAAAGGARPSASARLPDEVGPACSTTTRRSCARGSRRST
jgi:hypothetical protein